MPDSAGLGATHRAFERAALQHDAAQLGAFYSDSAAFIAPGLPTLRGRTAIESLFQHGLATTWYDSFRFEPAIVAGRGGIVTETGWQRDVSHGAAGGTTLAFGRYLITWRRENDGAWRMLLDAVIVDSTRAGTRDAPGVP